MIKILFLFLFFIINNALFSQVKKNKSFKNQSKIETHSPRKKIIGSNKTACPDKSLKKIVDKKSTTNTISNSKAHIRRSATTMHFDVIKLEDIHLDIPSFKQFRNNMTDFTAGGEQEFQRIINKITVFLGTNHEGKGVGLKIMGSASQIPTSYDPQLPNNNINKDGSSIIRKTSIKNNSKLAKARADELAKKIKSVFPSIEIETPKLEEIIIGETKWTKETQAALNKAVLKKDKKALQIVYEPFQKDQWVKVESKERSAKSIKPESLKMYMISTSPSYKTMINDKETVIRNVFIVSKSTYEFIGGNLAFSSIKERDDYFSNNGFEVFSEQKNNSTRWYFLRGQAEKNAFKTQNPLEKIYNLYHLNIVDALDESILENKIREDLRVNP